MPEDKLTREDVIRIVQELFSMYQFPVRLNNSPQFQSKTNTPSGGSNGVGILLGTTKNFGIFFGSGVPTLSAGQGSIYLRSDGSSTSTRLYVNTDGGTTWTNFTSAT